METFTLENKGKEPIQTIKEWQIIPGDKIPALKFVRPGESITLPHDLALVAQKKGLVCETVIPVYRPDAEDEDAQPLAHEEIGEHEVVETGESKKVATPKTAPKYERMTVKELKEELVKRNLPFEVGALKRDMVNLLKKVDGGL